MNLAAEPLIEFYMNNTQSHLIPEYSQRVKRSGLKHVHIHLFESPDANMKLQKSSGERYEVLATSVRNLVFAVVPATADNTEVMLDILLQ